MSRVVRKNLAALTIATAFAQEPRDSSEPLIRVTSTLVQVDAIVTDRQGRPATGLEQADFEILQDGKPREISSFQFVEAVRAAGPRRDTGPVPPRELSRAEVRRTVAIVVDDLGISFASMNYVRESLKKFVEKNLAEGDIAAIVRTGGGPGASQEFTADRARLAAIAERLRWNPIGRSGTAPFAALDDQSADVEEMAAAMSQEQEEYFALGSIGALQSIVAGLAEMPGRKSIILFSEGLTIVSPDQGATRVTRGLEGFIDSANRAAVSIYTVDPRGLQTAGFTAADGGNPGRRSTTGAAALERRRQANRDSQMSLQYIARETGGLYFQDDNDLARGLDRALADQQSYYLLAFRPADNYFDGRFHRITVRVKKPGFNVRSRGGFLGTEEKKTAAPERLEPAARQLMRAISSPFRSNGVRTRLSCYFGSDGTSSLVQSALHIDGRDIQFEKTPEGNYRGKVEILVAGFDESGAVAGQTTQGYQVNVDERGRESAERYGLSYLVRYKANRPGPFQVRAAVRDGVTGKVGSASQFLTVPDLSKERLALSGIMLMEPPQAGVQPFAMATVSARTFQRGRQMRWAAQIFHPKAGPDGVPRIETSVRIFRDGKQVLETPFQPVEAKALDGRHGIITAGTMKLGSAMTPGEYVLRLVVRDLNVMGAAAAQWIDFQVAE